MENGSGDTAINAAWDYAVSGAPTDAPEAAGPGAPTTSEIKNSAKDPFCQELSAKNYLRFALFQNIDLTASSCKAKSLYRKIHFISYLNSIKTTHLKLPLK